MQAVVFFVIARALIFSLPLQICLQLLDFLQALYFFFRYLVFQLFNLIFDISKSLIGNFTGVMFKVSYVIFEHSRNIFFTFRMQALYFFIVLLQLTLHLFIDSGRAAAASKAFCILYDMLDFMDERFFLRFNRAGTFQNRLKLFFQHSFLFFQGI